MTTAKFNWREWAQEWDRMFTTERANWLHSSGMGHSGWANESFNALPRSIQEAFAKHVQFVRAIHAYR